MEHLQQGFAPAAGMLGVDAKLPPDAFPAGSFPVASPTRIPVVVPHGHSVRPEGPGMHEHPELGVGRERVVFGKILDNSPSHCMAARVNICSIASGER